MAERHKKCHREKGNWRVEVLQVIDIALLELSKLIQLLLSGAVLLLSPTKDASSSLISMLEAAANPIVI